MKTFGYLTILLTLFFGQYCLGQCTTLIELDCETITGGTNTLGCPAEHCTLVFAPPDEEYTQCNWEEYETLPQVLDNSIVVMTAASEGQVGWANFGLGATKPCVIWWECNCDHADQDESPEFNRCRNVPESGVYGKFFTDATPIGVVTCLGEIDP